MHKFTAFHLLPKATKSPKQNLKYQYYVSTKKNQNLNGNNMFIYKNLLYSAADYADKRPKIYAHKSRSLLMTYNLINKLKHTKYIKIKNKNKSLRTELSQLMQRPLSRCLRRLRTIFWFLSPSLLALTAPATISPPALQHESIDNESMIDNGNDSDDDDDEILKLKEIQVQ